MSDKHPTHYISLCGKLWLGMMGITLGTQLWDAAQREADRQNQLRASQHPKKKKRK